MKERIYKFRAWDTEEKVMYEVYAMDWEGGSHKIVTAHLYADGKSKKVYPDEKMGDQIEFMQYTGLKDSKGREIFEGDLVQYHVYTVGKTFTGEVVWDDRWANFMLRSHEWEEADWVKITNVEVIGNRYENPELLREIKKRE